jgi:hypothetical protein
MIASLQKGLRLSYKRRELIGEGAGFGVPVLVYSDKTYFSSSSHVTIRGEEKGAVIRKEFLMDRVNRREFRGIGLKITKKGHVFPLIDVIYRQIVKVYMRFQRWLLFPLTGIGVKLGLRTDFIRAQTAGKVVVTYQVNQNKIEVSADFTSVRKDALRMVMILNEQGSRYFQRYSDSQGEELPEGQMREWSKVGAKFAAITDQSGKAGFRLWSKEESAMYRGREFVRGYLDWIGLDYAVRPAINAFAYQIEILGGGLHK